MKFKILTAILLLLLFAPTFSQDSEEGEEDIALVDGTKLTGIIKTVTDNGLTVQIEDKILISIPWRYLEPEYAYEFKKEQWKKKIKGKPSVSNLIELAKWCEKQGLDDKALTIYEDIINNYDKNNQTSRKALGYIWKEGRWWKSKDWNDEIAKRRDEGKTAPDDTEDPDDETTGPDDRIIKVKLKVSTTFELKPRSPKENYSQSLQEVLTEDLEKMGIEVVKSGAEFSIEGNALVIQKKAVIFMEEVTFVSFTSDLSVTIKNVKTEEEFKRKVTAQAGRSDMQEAIDDLFSELSSSMTTRIKSVCK